MPKGMTNIELKEFMYSLKSEIKAEIKTQTTIIDEVISPKMKEMAELQKEANGRVGKLEDRINAVEDTQLVQGNTCKFIQDGKARASSRNKWIITTLVALLALLAGTFYKDRQASMVPLELIYKQTDSTFVIPRMYLRKEGNQGYSEVHELYIDIEETVKK